MSNLKDEYVLAYQQQNQFKKDYDVINYKLPDLREVDIYLPKDVPPFITSENAGRIKKIIKKLTGQLIETEKKKGVFNITINGKKRDIIIELILFNGFSLSDFQFKVTINFNK